MTETASRRCAAPGTSMVDYRIISSDNHLGLKLRDIIGLGTLPWGSDYPHQESTFPRSREILEELLADRTLADCSEEEKAKIAGRNAARVYQL